MDECWLEYGLVKAGYKEARINQRKVIECYTARRDVFFVSPTGSGKSLTFEVAPFVLDKQHNRSGITSHMVLVVSPLVALMRMQTKELIERGIQLFIWEKHLTQTTTAVTACMISSPGKINNTCLRALPII